MRRATRVYTHLDPGTQVLDRGAALQTVDILKGMLRRRHRRHAPFDDRRPAFGKTGTQEDNTNAWFVGGTTQLSTAVWVGDPTAYTPMNGIPEFVAEGDRRVQGGTFPAEIWKAFMEPAHASLPVDDWDRPPPPAGRTPGCSCPGNECVVSSPGPGRSASIRTLRRRRSRPSTCRRDGAAGRRS